MFNHPHTTKYHLFCDFLMLGDKIFHCVIWKELFKFPIKLRSQCLIVCYDQRWFIQLLDDIRHGKCLTRSGDAKQCLTLIAFFKTFD